MTKDQTKQSIFSRRKKRILPAALISVALPFMIFVAVPFDIFCHNLNEFQFSAANFIGFCLLFFFGFSVLNFAILYFVPKTVYRIISGLLIGTLIMCFIQTNFLNGHLTSLQGDELGGGVPTGTTVFNTILWVVVELGTIALFLFVFNKGFIRGLTIALSAVLLLSQGVSFASLALGTDGFGDNSLSRIQNEDPNFVPTFLTTKNLTTISETNNVFVFCIDRMDGKDFAEPAIKNHPEYFSELEGFTYYEDATSLYGHTYPSVAYMITGEEYKQEKRKEYLNNAYKNNKTLSNLDKAGYMINLYTESYYAYYNAFYMPDYIDNLETASLESITFENKTNPTVLSLRMAELSLYRCLPYIAKGIAAVSTSAINGEVAYKSDELEYPESSSNMKNIFDTVTNSTFKTTDQKVFSFIHLDGCHSVEYDDNWEKTSSNDINLSIGNSFKIINLYLKEMKRLGVYEDATIIISADHGKGSAISDLSSLSVENLSAFFVKKSGVKSGELKTSKAQVSHTDLWATIFESENLLEYKGTANSVFDFEGSTQNRERKFVWHTWNLTASNSTEYVYTINGSARDFVNWGEPTDLDLNRYLFD